jgi:hypothetical protein
MGGPLLALACPVGMCAIMWLMARGAARGLLRRQQSGPRPTMLCDSTSGRALRSGRRPLALGIRLTHEP